MLQQSSQFAAANLSKDTTTDSANNLVNKHTNEIMATKAKGSVYDITSGTGEDGRRRLEPTSMLKSDAQNLWADVDDGAIPKVRYTCGESNFVDPLPTPGKRTGFKYTYGNVVIECSNKSNTCTVSGLGCVYASDGGSSTNNDVDHVWTSCPPNDVFNPTSDLFCDDSVLDACPYTPKPCWNACTEQWIEGSPLDISCLGGIFDRVPIHDCPEYSCPDPNSF